MPPHVTGNARAVAEKAREVIAKVRPGPLEGRRSLPIRSDPDELRRLWADADARAAVLDGVPSPMRRSSSARRPETGA